MLVLLRALYVPLASLEARAEKNGSEGKSLRSQDTRLALDNQRSKIDSYVCDRYPFIGWTNVASGESENKALSAVKLRRTALAVSVRRSKPLDSIDTRPEKHLLAHPGAQKSRCVVQYVGWANLIVGLRRRLINRSMSINHLLTTLWQCGLPLRSGSEFRYSVLLHPPPTPYQSGAVDSALQSVRRIFRATDCLFLPSNKPVPPARSYCWPISPPFAQSRTKEGRPE